MKPLYRSKTERMPGGVCTGSGEHLDIDPVVIRLIQVAVTVLSFGTGIVVNILAWILSPQKKTRLVRYHSPRNPGDSADSSSDAGV